MYSVWYVLRDWVVNHFYDFSEDKTLLTQMNKFVNETICASPIVSLAKSGGQLKALIQQKVHLFLLRADEFKMVGSSSLTSRIIPSNAPKPFMPNGRIESVLDVNPTEFSRQAALMEFESFSKIKPSECFNLAWSKKDSATKAPNIVKFIHRFNKVFNRTLFFLIAVDGPVDNNNNSDM